MTSVVIVIIVFIDTRQNATAQKTGLHVYRVAQKSSHYQMIKNRINRINRIKTRE